MSACSSIQAPDAREVDQHFDRLYVGLRAELDQLLVTASGMVRFETDRYYVEIVGDRHEYSGERILSYLQGVWVRSARGHAIFLYKGESLIAQAWPKFGNEPIEQVTEQETDQDDPAALPALSPTQQEINNLRGVATVAAGFLLLVFAGMLFCAWFI